MRKIIFTLLCFFQLSLSAQDSTSAIFWDVSFGYKTIKQDFYKQLNTPNSLSFSSPLQIVGIKFNAFSHVIPRFDGYVHYGYSKIIPQPIYLQDTLKGKITGGAFNFALGYIIKSKPVNLYIYTGFNTGRLRIFGNELLRQKNPFFSPKAGGQIWFKFGKMALTGAFEYEYDVSKVNWRRTYFANKDKADIAPLRQTGITATIGVSIRVG